MKYKRHYATPVSYQLLRKKDGKTVLQGYYESQTWDGQYWVTSGEWRDVVKTKVEE